MGSHTPRRLLPPHPSLLLHQLPLNLIRKQVLISMGWKMDGVIVAAALLPEGKRFVRAAVR